METTGEIFQKLKLAVEYNVSAPPTKGEATTIQKRLPNLSHETDRLSTETLKRFKNILYGPHAGAFCQIMDIFVSGYGKLDIDNDVLCVRLIFEEKIKF